MARGAPALALLLALASFVAPQAARAAITGGGGGAKKDCMAVFDAPVNFPATRPRHVFCTDGDPACDSDGLVDGVCSIPVTVCTNSSFDPTRCGPRTLASSTVDHALDNGDKKFDPDFQALQQRIDGDIGFPTSTPDQCTAPVVMTVPIRGPFGNGNCRRGVKRVRLDTLSSFGPSGFDRDRDALRLVCEPATCDPQVLFLSTFDRIQRQIFDASCALGGCHDSQGLSGGLLLEAGSAFGNLVGVAPSNGSALAAGWQRVTPGDVQASYIHHKLDGHLDVGFGARMPFGGRKLPRYLRDLVDLWIAAGAPGSGWVPGTF